MQLDGGLLRLRAFARQERQPTAGGLVRLGLNQGARGRMTRARNSDLIWVALRRLRGLGPGELQGLL